MMNKEEKQTLINEVRVHETDSGSPEVQVALLSKEIEMLTEHLKLHKKDFSSKRGLLMKVAHRKKLLAYLQKNSVKRYEQLIARLGLRK